MPGGIPGDGLIRVERVRVLAERADHHAAAFDRPAQRVHLGLVGEQLVRIAMCGARMPAAAQLDRLHAQAGQPVEHLLERRAAVQHGEDPESHVER